jgi:3-oxoacyl-[acyl-carrier protein] reductase
MSNFWPGRFSGANVIVTGGASGIGEATVLRFLREGANVLVFDIDSTALEAADEGRSRASTEGGGRAIAHRGDVTVPEDVDSMIDHAVREFGGVDVLVSNAGIAYEEPFLEISLDHWAQTIETNLTSMFLVCQRVGRHMVQRAGPRSINLTSSTNGLVGEDQYAHYNASKGGVTLLTKSLAIELGPYGIRVNAVCPGYIVTPLAESIDSPEFMDAYAQKLPIRHLGKPEDVAAAFAFLSSSDASFITGETLVIDGGQLTY